jgi:hypothetical protein
LQRRIQRKRNIGSRFCQYFSHFHTILDKCFKCRWEMIQVKLALWVGIGGKNSHSF